MHTRDCLHACITVTCIPCTVLTHEKARTCLLNLKEEARRVTVTVPHLATEGKGHFRLPRYVTKFSILPCFPPSQKLAASAPASWRRALRRWSLRPFPADFLRIEMCFCHPFIAIMTYISLDRRRRKDTVHSELSRSVLRLILKRSEIECEHVAFLSLSFTGLGFRV